MLKAQSSMHRRTPGFESLAGHCCSIKDAAHCSLAFTYMFFRIQPRTSDAVAFLQVSPILGVVLVEFTNGYAYEYTNVSRRAIANLLLNPNMSLGFWVNNNCIRPERTQSLTLQYIG